MGTMRVSTRIPSRVLRGFLGTFFQGSIMVAFWILSRGPP